MQQTPPDPGRNFLKTFSKFLRPQFRKISFYVLGDFNIDLNKVGKSNFVTKHVHHIISLPCNCAIDLPTSITDHSETLIKHIYENDSKHFYICDVALWIYVTASALLSK